MPLGPLKIRPCLWFDNQAEEAVAWYLSIFPDSRITNLTRYTEAGFEVHRMPPGTVMTISFELLEQPFTALNGGPVFHFSEAVSFEIDCESQAETDYYWDRLSAGGDPDAQRCGWLKDQYGLSWQIIPRGLEDLLADPGRGERVMQALLQMKKIDLLTLRRV